MGTILGSVSVNYVGCKKSMFILLIPMACCWALTIAADSAEWLYLARLLGGISLGMTFSTYPLYIGEVSLPKIRGALVSTTIVGITFALMMGSIIGATLSMRVSAIIYIIPCLILMAVFLWLPESPYHLVKSKNQLLYL